LACAPAWLPAAASAINVYKKCTEKTPRTFFKLDQAAEIVAVQEAEEEENQDEVVSVLFCHRPRPLSLLILPGLLHYTPLSCW